MVTRTARRQSSRGARSTGRRAANSEAMRWLARAGLAARGVTYVIIGWIAVQVAFGRSRQQADRTGALHSISSTPVGGALLWLLVIGFIGMALWQLSEALYGSPGSGGSKTSKRLAAFARAIMYGVIAYGVLKYALGLGSPQSSDTQSVDLTAQAIGIDAQTARRYYNDANSSLKGEELLKQMSSVLRPKAVLESPQNSEPKPSEHDG